MHALLEKHHRLPPRFFGEFDVSQKEHGQCNDEAMATDFNVRNAAELAFVEKT